MNPTWWILAGIIYAICHLLYMLTIQFRLARLDDDVAEPDLDVHNDMKTWSYEYYFPRVKARKMSAFLRWLGVSAAVMVVCVLLSGGGRQVMAMGQPTPSLTPTSTVTASPTITPTPGITETNPTYTPMPTSTVGPTATPVIVYKPGQNVQVVVTQIVKVTKIVIQTQIITATPGPTQTPWVIYVTSQPTATPTASETASPTPTETPTPTSEVTP
jgi:hypothetical protein